MTAYACLSIIVDVVNKEDKFTHDLPKIFLDWLLFTFITNIFTFWMSCQICNWLWMEFSLIKSMNV